MPTTPATAEHARLAEATGRAEDDLFTANPWYEWGPYLSERAWGTVREDYSESGDAWDSFPHDHARSRAYRWNEDGMAGISDIRHELCLALALWNGSDPILKERMFGLTGPQGNHGEDVKEYWWYLEGLPSHALLQLALPLPAGRVPLRRSSSTTAAACTIPSSSCSTPASFDDDRYWSVDVTYAKASPTEVLMRIELENHGPDEATLDVLPTLWFRNTWSWERRRARGRGSRATARRSSSPTTRSPATGSTAAPGPGRRGARGALLRERDERAARLRLRARRRRTRRTASTTTSSRARPRSTRTGFGTKARAALPRDRAGRRQGRAAAAAAPARDGAGRRAGDWAGDAVRRRSSPRARPTPTSSTPRSRRPAPTPEQMRILRQACAGLVWSKQMYPYNVRRWLDGDPGEPPPPEAHRHGRNSGWRHLDAFDVLAMPDPWEYPWFAAWDLGFHAIPWAHLDPGVREVPAARAAARVVPAPERRAARLRVELRRRQPAGARDGGAARVPRSTAAATASSSSGSSRSC